MQLNNPRQGAPRAGWLWGALVTALAVIAIAGCGDGEPPGQSDAGEEAAAHDNGRRGNIAVALSSSAVSDVLITGVLVSIRGIELHRVDGGEAGWVAAEANSALLEAPLNLLHLRGGISMDLLADEPVPPGTYNEVRLRLAGAQGGAPGSDGVVELNGDGEPGGLGVEQPLYVPSGTTSGIKFKLAKAGGIEVVEGSTVTLVSAFDLQRSLHISTAGGEVSYLLHPTVRTAAAATVGTIGGSAVPGMPACPVLLHAYAAGDYEPKEAQAQNEAQRFRQASASAGLRAGEDGPEYRLGALAAGVYGIIAAAYDVGSGHYLDGSATSVTQGVAVAAGEDTALDLALPGGICGA